MCLDTVEVQALTSIKGINFAQDVRFRQLIITGPPGSGKSTLVKKLGGWPEEGYLDLAQKHWWRSPVLNLRPREVHCGLPFCGDSNSHAVFDREWIDHPSDLVLERIEIPPRKKYIWSADWRRKYVFDFQLLPPALIYSVRQQRCERRHSSCRQGTHSGNC